MKRTFSILAIAIVLPLLSYADDFKTLAITDVATFASELAPQMLSPQPCQFQLKSQVTVSGVCGYYIDANGASIGYRANNARNPEGYTRLTIQKDIAKYPGGMLEYSQMYDPSGNPDGGPVPAGGNSSANTNGSYDDDPGAANGTGSGTMP